MNSFAVLVHFYPLNMASGPIRNYVFCSQQIEL